MKHIELRNVTKYEGWGKKKKAIVKAVHLFVRRGECLAVYGRRSTGKTTLLNLLTGKVQADDGQIRIGKHEITLANKEDVAEIRRSIIGLYSSGLPLLEGITVEENIRLMQFVRKQKRSNAALQEAVHSFQIESLLSKYTNELNFYEKEAVLFVRALSTAPELVLVDEPKNVDLLQNLIHYAHSRGQTLIYATCDWDLAQLSPGVVQLINGELVEGTEGQDERP